MRLFKVNLLDILRLQARHHIHHTHMHTHTLHNHHLDSFCIQQGIKKEKNLILPFDDIVYSF